MNPEDQNVPSTQPTVTPTPVQPPTQPVGQPVVSPEVTQSPMSQPAPKNKGKLLLTILLILLVLAGGGVAAYKVLTSDADTTETADSIETSDKTSDTRTDTTQTTTTDTTTTSTAAKDVARKAALNALATDIESYYGEMVYYPAATQMSTASFAASNLPTFNKIKANSTETSAMTISSTLSDTTFAYKATPDGCNNTSKDCMMFEVSVNVSEKQSDGTYVYKKSALN